MKYLSDYHLHSYFSFDGKQSMEEAVIQAIKNNINELCFTEHVSFDPEDKSYKTFKFTDYKNEIERLSSIYSDSIKIKAGIESGEYHFYEEDFDKYYKNNDIDFIIGSVHNVNNKGLRTNLKEYGEQVSYEDYFKEILILSEVGDFDVLGHLDIIQRYAFNYYGIYDLSKYKEYIHEILKTLISRGKGIEINTSGLHNNILFPKLEILKMYKDLNGEIITVGSDAHDSIRVGKNISYTYDILKSLDFKYVFTFNKRNKHGILI
ncbi:putative histidinol phosphate phosphatase [Clostridium neonatale]|uniref:histidinol-phosphatase HisJ family protein n=1 Tax=Clostridium neonatale TaxID=137838 RepID=UPI00291BF88E|nr:putative histidinol phosphate phosphatase [Clostridium neonatale]